jgi:hypothetical protein
MNSQFKERRKNMGLAEKYCDLINDNFGGTYYPTWLPSVSMLLGDYGVLEDDVFTKQGEYTRLRN